MIDNKDISDFVNSIIKDMSEEAIETKKSEIVDILTSNNALQAAKSANAALTKSGLEGVTADPSKILDSMKSDGESITLSLSEEDDRLLRYDDLYGNGIFKDLGIKRNLNADS